MRGIEFRPLCDLIEIVVTNAGRTTRPLFAKQKWLHGGPRHHGRACGGGTDPLSDAEGPPEGISGPCRDTTLGIHGLAPKSVGVIFITGIACSAAGRGNAVNRHQLAHKAGIHAIAVACTAAQWVGDGDHVVRIVIGELRAVLTTGMLGTQHSALVVISPGGQRRAAFVGHTGQQQTRFSRLIAILVADLGIVTVGQSCEIRIGDSRQGQEVNGGSGDQVGKAVLVIELDHGPVARLNLQ